MKTKHSRNDLETYDDLRNSLVINLRTGQLSGKEFTQRRFALEQHFFGLNVAQQQRNAIREELNYALSNPTKIATIVSEKAGAYSDDLWQDHEIFNKQPETSRRAALFSVATLGVLWIYGHRKR